MSIWVPGYVETNRFFDAEHCPDPAPAGYEGCLVYAGGSSAAHAWDLDEIRRAKSVVKRMLPVWVPTPGSDNPVKAGQDFVAWLKAHNVPTSKEAGYPVHLMWDAETGKEPDPGWLDIACQVTSAAGWWNLIYGSLSVIFFQPPRDGYVVANPTGQPHMYPHQMVKATQYAFNVPVTGGTIDQSLVSVELAGQLWAV